MKVCCSTTFYNDNGSIEYMGYFYKNKRHGYGKQYDQQGNLVYEGNWVNNHALTETSVELKGKLNENEFHYGLENLTLDDTCEWNHSYMIISHYSHLKRLHLNKQCTRKQLQFQITHCDCLTEVVIGKVEEDPGEEEEVREKEMITSSESFSICYCPQLNRIVIGDDCFDCFTGDIQVVGMNNHCCLNRSPFTYCIIYWLFFIPTINTVFSGR